MTLTGIESSICRNVSSVSDSDFFTFDPALEVDSAFTRSLFLILRLNIFCPNAM